MQRLRLFSSSSAIYLLLFLAFVVIASGIGLRDPWPADEPRFVLIAKEMIETQQWLFPQRGGELYPDKPPIFIWLQAIVYGLTGEIRAFLLPSLFASIATLVLVYDLARRLWNRTIAIAAAFSLLVSVQFTMQAKLAQIDAVLCFWVTLGLYGLLRHILRGPSWGWYFTAFFAMGCGIITKGVGFLPVLLLPALYLYNFYVKDTSFDCLTLNYGTKKSYWGWFFLLFPILIWLIPMVVASIDGSSDYVRYRDNIIFRQTVKRYADSWHHIKPFWFYVVQVLPWAWFPLILTFPSAFLLWKKRLIQRKDPRFFLIIVWIILTLLFFSFSKGKRGVYMLPTLPALSLIVAPVVVLLFKKATLKVTFHRCCTIVAFFVVGVIECIALYQYGWGDLDHFSVGFHQALLFFALFFLAFSGASFFVFRSRQGAWFLASVLLGFWLWVPLFFYSHFNDIRTPHLVFNHLKEVLASEAVVEKTHELNSPSIKKIAAENREIEKGQIEKIEIGMIHFREQFILFSPFAMTHFGYHTSIEDQAKAAMCWVQKKPNARRLFMSERIAVDFFPLSKQRALGDAHGDKWVLLDIATDSSNQAPLCDASMRFFSSRI